MSLSHIDELELPLIYKKDIYLIWLNCCLDSSGNDAIDFCKNIYNRGIVSKFIVINCVILCSLSDWIVMSNWIDESIV